MEKTSTNMLRETVPIRDELGRLQDFLEKALIVHEEVNNDFFNLRGKENFTECEQATVLYNYGTASAKADIVDDYPYRMKEVLEPLTKSVDQLRDQLRKEGANHA